MKTNARTRFLKETDVGPDELAARQPFKMEQQNQRRFVRLEISAPMSLQKIRDAGNGFWPEGDSHIIHGLILNISAGGILVDLNEAINLGDVVSMRFTLQEVEALDYILGLVKRVDQDADGVLAGIEFITREDLQDMFSKGEIDVLSERYCGFDRSIRQVLDKYVYQEKDSSDKTES